MKNSWKDPAPTPSKKTILNPEEIVYMVTKNFGRLERNPSKARHKTFVRHLICYLLRKYTEMSRREIGKVTNYSDRTGSIYGDKVIKDLIDVYPDIRARIEKVEKLLVEGVNNFSLADMMSCFDVARLQKKVTKAEFFKNNFNITI